MRMASKATGLGKHSPFRLTIMTRGRGVSWPSCPLSGLGPESHRSLPHKWLCGFTDLVRGKWGQCKPVSVPPVTPCLWGHTGAEGGPVCREPGPRMMTEATPTHGPSPCRRATGRTCLE